jgi:hypothetical protein
MKLNRFKISAYTFLFCIFLRASSAAEIHDALRHGVIAKAMDLLTNNPSLISLKDEDGDYTSLHWASQLGQTNVVRWLLENKADPNAVADINLTPLHLAKNGAVAKLLLQHGADPNKIDGWGKTPLQTAAELAGLSSKVDEAGQHFMLGVNGNDEQEVANVILESGYPMDLASALWLGKRDEAKRIIKENPSMVEQVREDSDFWGNTSPLGIAAAQGDKEVVELLLKAGAPVNAVTKNPNGGNLTPLFEAVWAGNADIVEIFCKAGADCKGTINGNLLEWAKQHSNKKIVDLLVRYWR